MASLSLSGRVFDIRRFSVHDGDGIRTTIFLKGCPLSCKWCQNPEGISLAPHLFYFKNKCIRCGQCIGACPSGALSRDAEGYIRINRETCVLNFACADICPARALAADSEIMTTEEVVQKVLSDLPFFKYGGGVTLSGGEPFLQFDFALEILKKLKKISVNTAVESSLFVPEEKLLTALPFINTLFADLKILDSGPHKAATGVPNELILKNIATVLTRKEQHVIIRTPLIPGFTANAKNIRAIARFLVGINPNVSYELLNYNPLAMSKYSLLEKEYCCKENPPLYTAKEMDAWREIARNAGIKNVIG